MTPDERKDLAQRQYAEYLIQNREYLVSETYSDRDARYADVDRLLRGEWGYKLPGENAVVEPPMVMNLGLAFVNDVSRLVMEQQPVYKAPAFGEAKSDLDNAQLREVVGETYWEENRGDILMPQLTNDLVVCGAAYTVTWYDGNSPYPQFTRIDPRHAYPTVVNGKLQDLLVIHTFPKQVAQSMFGLDLGDNIKSDVEVWEYYKPGHASRWLCTTMKDGGDRAATVLDATVYDPDCMPAQMVQLPSHDGAQRGMLDQLGPSLEAKNKIVSLMAKYTEHKVFAPWESKGILNPNDTPGPNTIYHHDPNSQVETFMRRVEPAGSDPQLFQLMNLMDLDQRGGIGYPASRQGEVGQSIASAAFVESTQGQLSSIVKNVQAQLADLRSQATQTMMKFDVYYLDITKPLCRSVGKKNTYKPSTVIKDRFFIRVQYGAGAGMSRQNTDTRVINMLGARLISREAAREQIEFLRDRSDMQDQIEAENAEDALQQIFWPDPTIPIDVKFRVKKLMGDEGLSLSDAYDEVRKALEAEGQASQQAAAEAQAQQPQLQPVAPDATAAQDQALALEKGQVVQEPHDIELPSAPLEQIFIGN